MVVLLAIAGTVAAVLLNRAATTTDQLEEVETVYDRAATLSECKILGGSPVEADLTTATDDPAAFAACNAP